MMLQFPSSRSLFSTCVLCDEMHFRHVVGVRPDTELADLRVKRKLVKPHGAHDGNKGGLAVQHILLLVDPQSRQLREHVDHFECLEVVDENVGQPQVLDKLHICGDRGVLRSRGGPKGG